MLISLLIVFTDESSVFMCKICNLFSPNKSLLLSHVLDEHADRGGDAEDIIIPLKPLQSPQAPGILCEASMSTRS